MSRQQNKMLADERRARIMEELEHKSTVLVADLCKKFDVSEVTVRSDLKKLEDAGKLRRTRGGAVSIMRTITISYPDQRMNVNSAAKRAIASKAAELISDGESLMVDTGTTTFEFVRALTDKRDITIVTSDLSIATYADSNLPHADVICLGGHLRKNHRYITGMMTLRNLSEIFADKAILATDAYTPGKGFTTEFMGNAEVKRGFLAQARDRIMLMDASKVRAPRFVKFGDISDFDTVVMDYDPEGKVAETIKSSCAQTRLELIDKDLIVGRDVDSDIGRERTKFIED
ncbi:MAG: DeoR/GlpR transcriptional regulator [Coriobacteriaceae bacterium]|nr:MAG: DeoR/GlpR transcriptional regulator [Coriobacteriaceae bacterium]